MCGEGGYVGKGEKGFWCERGGKRVDVRVEGWVKEVEGIVEEGVVVWMR